MHLAYCFGESSQEDTLTHGYWGYDSKVDCVNKSFVETIHFRTIIVNISHVILVVTLYQYFFGHQSLLLDC